MLKMTTRSKASLVILCAAALYFIELGARLHSAEIARSGTNHWAFQQAIRLTVPNVRNTSWPANSVDKFILAEIEKRGLAPSASADRRILIRRLSFDLLGLPPTPEEVERFVRDGTPRAYEDLVDRMLGSPQYGERWARHWLDVVHFGETHGYDKDKPRRNAWPYRDYVIRAFNTDKPYSRFIEEQLAGDVLFPDDPDGVIATGFLAAGPWDFVGHVELPESKTDGLIARYNDRDDMLMTAMTTFQSLTVHCARCHDHKFDPISQRDYYSLQAVFAGVDRADRWFDSDPVLFAKRKELLWQKNDLEAKQRALQEVVSRVTSPEIERTDALLTPVTNDLGALPKRRKDSPSNGYHSAIESASDSEKWVQVDLVNSVAIDEIRLIPARPTDFTDMPGFGFPVRFRVDVSEDETFPQRSAIIDQTEADVSNPGESPYAIAAKGQRGRFVRVTATRLWKRTGDYVFALAELQVLAGTNNAALGGHVTALDSIEAGRWGKARLVDGYDSRQPLGAANEAPELAAKRQTLEEQKRKLEEQRKSLIESLLAHETKIELANTARGISRISDQLEKLPKPQMVYAACSDFAASGNFVAPAKPRPIHLLQRGDVRHPGELMAAGALSCLPGLPGRFDLPAEAGEGSRRAALAKWVSDSKNLLTRRSLVNRVWQYHFGRGLVDTSNDFGHMGSAPTHPELLDWLAFWFLDHGESLKQLHRLLVASSTYRQLSTDNSAFARIDAENRLLWRMNRGRLDAESYRDALLRVSGRLDLTAAGPSVEQFFFKDDHSPIYDYTRYDLDQPGSNRRSIYRFIVRSAPDPFMECLDSADPSLMTAKRNTTITALQALATLNNPFVLKQTEHFAARLGRASGKLEEQIEMAYQLALARAPRSDEAKLMFSYARKHGMAAACRVLVNSNEFMFLD
jgi:hypothetical protein